jgi:hypothetical protein
VPAVAGDDVVDAGVVRGKYYKRGLDAAVADRPGELTGNDQEFVPSEFSSGTCVNRTGRVG